MGRRLFGGNGMKKSIYELLLRSAALFGIPARMFARALKKHSTNLIVLMYHDVDMEQFRNHLHFLDKHFHLIDLDELVQLIERCEFPSDLTAAITFDDGLQSFYHNAIPIVDETGIPVANYVTSGVIDSEYWYKPGQDRIFIPGKTETETSQVILPKNQHDAKESGFIVKPGLTSEQLLEASKHPKITIGAHSVTHRLLPETTYDECKREIYDSKKDLENLTGHEVRHFAYPGGGFSEREVLLVQEAGFASAASSQDIWVPREVSPFIIPRKGAGSRGASLNWLQYRIGK
jgi:peptidoglycan/xylan/chitin deacetylase (PgdA/CDA1 family)